MTDRFRCWLDTFFEEKQLDLEALALAVARIHPDEYLGPVLRLGAAGTRLHVEEAVVGVHRVREHEIGRAHV